MKSTSRRPSLDARLSTMSLLSDFRFAGRTILRRPAFTATVVATLALGIGGNTAVFSLVDAVILHPIDVGHPESLVAIYKPGRATAFGSSTIRSYGDLAVHSRSLAGVAAEFTSTVALREGDVPRDLSVAFVTDEYFSVLEVPAQIGRTFAPADTMNGGSQTTVVLSDALWRGRFSADPEIVGRKIHLGTQRFTVIGVAPERFRGTNLVAPPDAWVPVAAVGPLNLSLVSRGGKLNADVPIFNLFGRLAAGTSAQGATAELGRFITGATVVPLTDAASGIRSRGELTRFIGLLFGVVALTLLLGCVNVANLLVVRGAERAWEVGVRAAMGASARRLVQQTLTESLALAVAGGVLGLVVAVAMLRLLAAYTLPGGVLLDHLRLGIDVRVLAFTSGVSVLTAIGFGLAPAFHVARTNVVDALWGREGTRSARRSRSVLLAAQVSISLMLVVGAGLFVRSVQAGLNTDLGFDPRPLAAVSVQTKFDGRHADAIRPLLAIVEQSARSPGIIAAAASSHVPLGGTWRMAFTAGEGDRDTVRAPIASITPDYFKVIGVPLLAGRPFDERDRAGAERVVVINESAARRFFPGASALGRHLQMYGTDLTVVGIVRDMKYSTLHDRGVPFVYAPMLQQDFPAVATLVVRSLNPRQALAMLRRTVGAIAPDLKVLSGRARPRLVSEQIDTVLAPQHFGATLMSTFAIIALVVSGVGIYGTVAHSVARRTTEIGVRVALGARRSDVLSLVLRESGAAVIVGVGVGVVGALLTSRLLAHFLYEVTATDSIAFAMAVVVVSTSAIVAALVPAARALGVDPARAMRVL